MLGAGGSPINDIGALSLRARIALALRVFEDYCHLRGLDDVEVAAYLDHMWRFLIVEVGAEFDEWMAGEPALVFAGLGDDYPTGFEALLAARGVPEAEFRRVVSCTTEVLYGSMYAAANEQGSREHLGELARLAAASGVTFPDTRPFVNSRWSEGRGWGARPSLAEWTAWRERSDA